MITTSKLNNSTVFSLAMFWGPRADEMGAGDNGWGPRVEEHKRPFKVQSLWSCAHYFQWFTGYLNHVDLLMLHVAICFKETALLFNVHLSCFVDFILCPTNKYMFKVSNKKIRLICWMCSKLKINTAWHSSSVFIVDFDHSHHINIVFLLLTWTSICQ